MDVVSLQMAKVDTARRVSQLRRRNLPPLKNPTRPAAGTMATVTQTAGSTGLMTTGTLYHPQSSSQFTLQGGVNWAIDANNDLTNTNSRTNPSGGGGPWSIEFQTDASAFELDTKNGGGAFQVFADGLDVTGVLPALDSSGSRRQFKIDLGSRLLRVIRVEANGRFYCRGITFGGIDSVRATDMEEPFVILGDSFTEPTFADPSITNTTGFEGWPGAFMRCLGLRNVLFQGVGGTGYLNPSVGGKVKLRDRIVHDLIAIGAPRWIIAMGLNDANREPTYTANMVYAEVVTLLAQIKAGLPNSQGAVFSPFCSGNPSGSLIAFRDSIRQATTEAGLPFIDLLGLTPASQRISGTLTTATSSSPILTDVAFPRGAVLQIGTPSKTAASSVVFRRVVGNATGTGPYSHALSAGLSSTYPVGSQVVSTGYPHTYGTGTVSTPTGDGPADIVTGTDSTHPTVVGHAHIGMAAAAAYRAALGF